MAKDNVKIEFVTFSDYAMVNKALATGDIDIDSFQHYAYFDKDCEANGYDLTAIGEIRSGAVKASIPRKSQASTKLKTVIKLRSHPM